MLVRIQNEWSFPDIRQQSPGRNCVWNGVEFTFDPVAKCDLLIAYNPPNKDILVKVPAGNRWLFIGESPIEQYRWHLDSYPLFDKVFGFWNQAEAPNLVHEQTALPWHVGRSYDQLMALGLEEARQAKSARVSWVTSNASHKEGHKLRMAFKDHMAQQQFDFDLFGRGFTPIDDKFDGIAPYKYSIALENYSCNDYWTEKIADCFLSWTVPVYWGCSNILKYFPARSMIQIDPNDPAASLRTLRNAIDNDYYGNNLDALAEARELILTKYQLFPHVCAMIAKYGLQTGAPQRTFIPANAAHVGPSTPLTQLKRLGRRLLGA